MILIFFKMQPYDWSSLKIVLVILVAFLANYFLPSLHNAIYSMILKTGVISTVYIGLAYLLNIAPEFHKYIPFHKEK